MANSPLTTSNFHTAAQRRDVVEDIEVMSPREIPLIKLVGIDGKAGTNPKMEWLEDQLLAESTALAATGAVIGTAVTSSGTGTTLVVTAGEGQNLQVGMLIKVTDVSSGAWEYMYITAGTSSVDQFTVIRAVATFDGTSAYTGIEAAGVATFATTDTVDVVGLANREGLDAPLKSTTELVIPFNYFQAFDTSYKVSYMQEHTDVYGINQGDDARERAKAIEEITIKLEKTAFLGIRAADQQDWNVPTTNTNLPRTMGGLDFFLTSALNSLAGNYDVSLSSAQLTEKDLNDMLQNRYYAVGSNNMGTTIICGAWNKRRIADMFAPYARSARNERTGGVKVDTLDTDFGPIDVVMSLRCPTDRLYLVNLDYIKIHPYEGLSFFDEEKSSNGAYRVREIYGVYSLSLRNTRAFGRIRSTATS